MALSLSPVFQSMARQFTSSPNTQRFQEDFVDATNNAIDELIIAGDVTPSSLPHVESNDATISYLLPNHTAFLKAGIRYHLILLGQVPVAGGTDAVILAQRDWTDAKGNFYVSLSNADQAVVDEDDLPTSDIIGLGVKTHTSDNDDEE